MDEVRQRIAQARRIVAFTGAGISVESGIPTFRGPEGCGEDSRRKTSRRPERSNGTQAGVGVV